MLLFEVFGITPAAQKYLSDSHLGWLKGASQTGGDSHPLIVVTLVQRLTLGRYCPCLA